MSQIEKKYVEFELTAPGKVILFGEHSVVYGKKAVAAALGLYTKAHLKENNSDVICLHFPNILLEETFPLSGVREYFGVEDYAQELDSFVQVFEKFYQKYGSKQLTQAQRDSLITFFHSLGSSAQSCPGFRLSIETDLPVSSGAGSSASFSVILNTAILLLDIVKSNKLSEFVIRSENEIQIKEEMGRLISEKAFICEKFFHGTPSGIDHCVILHGSAVEFVKGVTGNSLKIIDGGTLRVLLVNTNVPRSTKKQVEIFRHWKQNLPEVMEKILEAMNEIASRGVEILSNMKKDSDGFEKHESELADLISLNHGLLRSVDISHESLEKVCWCAKKYGLSAKLTGAGGGGFAFIYISSQTTPNAVESLKKELITTGFEANEVILGGPGLRIKSLYL